MFEIVKSYFELKMTLIPKAPMRPTSTVRIIPLPRLAANGRWRVEAMRSLSEPCLLNVTKGMGRITVAGVTRGYSAGTIVFIPAGVMHGFEVGPQVLGTALFFGSDKIADLPASPQHFRLQDIKAQQEMNMLLEMITKEKELSTPAGDRAAHHYVGLLSVWLERQAAAAGVTAQRPDAAHRLVARYSDVIERSFRTGAGVGELAAELGVTPTHLTRCCRMASGRSAIELLQDRRIFEARQMLAETALPVGQISAALGFTSAAYFTRAFQNQTGLSPSAFRKSA
jgi:AraC family transcriptional regulator, transcriptional activator of pobA